MSKPSFSILEKMPVAVYICDLEGEITFYNPAAEKLWGRRPEATDRWCGSCKMYDEKGNYVPHEACPIAKLPENGEMAQCEITIERPDGTRRHLLVHPQRIYDADNNPSGIINTLIDISDQVKSRKKLEETEFSFNMMLMKSPFGFAVQKGQDMVVEFANDSIKKIWGKGNNVEGKALHDFLPELKEHGFLQILRDVLNSGLPYYAYEIHAPLMRNGILEDCYFNVVYQPYYQTKDIVSGVTTIAIEVTKEVEAKKRLMESEEKYRKLSLSLESQVKARTEALADQNQKLESLYKELEVFAQISSHDLQVPIRKAKMAISKMKDDELKPMLTNGNGHFHKVTASLDAMQTLVEDLQTYWESDRYEENFEMTDLDELVRTVVEGLSLQIEEKNAEIEYKSLGSASVVRFQFRQLFHNLISNALKYSNSDVSPEIKVRSTKSDDDPMFFPILNRVFNYIHISVADNGIGFDNKYKEKIFQPFQRLHPKHSINGTGIGLAIVKKIVDHHKGIISAHSELNKGATFDIYLPVLS